MGHNLPLYRTLWSLPPALGMPCPSNQNKQRCYLPGICVEKEKVEHPSCGDQTIALHVTWPTHTHHIIRAYPGSQTVASVVILHRLQRAQGCSQTTTSCKSNFGCYSRFFSVPPWPASPRLFWIPMFSKGNLPRPLVQPTTSSPLHVSSGSYGDDRRLFPHPTDPRPELQPRIYVMSHATCPEVPVFNVCGVVMILSEADIRVP